MKLGIWLLSSPDNLVVDSFASSKGDLGILLGNGHKSDNNVLTNSGGSGQKAGLQIDKVNRSNIVTVTRNAGSTPMVDENPKCDDNRWYNNAGQGNQPCIQ